MHSSVFDGKSLLNQHHQEGEEEEQQSQFIRFFDLVEEGPSFNESVLTQEYEEFRNRSNADISFSQKPLKDLKQIRQYIKKSLR